MKSKMYIDALSQALGRQVESNGDGSFAFALDGVPMLLHFQPVAASFLLHTHLGYPTTLGGVIHARLLGANFLLSETMGAAISLDERTGMACLEHLLSLQGLDGAAFVARVEGFVAVADIWTKRLQGWNDEIEDQVATSLDALHQSLTGSTEKTEISIKEATMLRV